jgi:hypothetical protein
MSLTLNLPPLDPNSNAPAETRPGKVRAWLEATVRRDAVEAARAIADVLAETNRLPMSDSRRLELADLYWVAADELWPQLEVRFSRAAHPLEGEALDAARVTLSLAIELSVAYKRLLASAADRRPLLGTSRRLPGLVYRCLECTARVLFESYRSYAPVPAKTWHDAHAIHAFALQRKLHQRSGARDDPAATPERLYLQMLLLALANPYAVPPGQLAILYRWLPVFSQWARLSEAPPIHHAAKAVALVPVAHDFPPFASGKGGSIQGSKLFLVAFDLAFQIQERLRAIEAGGPIPADLGTDSVGREPCIELLQRLLRQWAMPPTRHFNRLPARARVAMSTGLRGVWAVSSGARVDREHPSTPVSCEVVNQAPGGYALRQTGKQSSGVRIGEVIALRVEGKPDVQVALVRWVRNAMKHGGLEFGCELLAENPKAALGVPEDAPEGGLVPIVVLPEGTGGARTEVAPSQLIVPSDRFHIDDAVQLKRSGQFRVVVLTKVVERGPGFELYEFASVD